MKLLRLGLLLTACSSPMSVSGQQPDASGPQADVAPPSAGFSISIGQAYSSTATVTIAPQTDSNVYAGYYVAASDSSSTPSLSVSIHAASGSLASNQTFECARSTDSDDMDETSVLVSWLDGDTYYTNVIPQPACTITLVAVSQTSVSAQVSGTIYDEADANVTPHSFTASFVATAQ
jgi:hypothetical protein